MVMTVPDMKFRIEEVVGRMPERLRWELVRGALNMMTPAGGEHGRRAARMVALLDRYARDSRRGVALSSETGFVLQRNPDTLRAPDAAFITADRAHLVGEGFVEGAPDLAVEVVSPRDRNADVMKKAHHWLDAGAQAVWIVWPRDRRVTVLTKDAQPRELTEADSLTGAPALPGFSCPVAEIFE